jgi:hypothetical protein
MEIDVSISNLLVIPQSNDIHQWIMIANDAVIDNFVSLYFSNLPIDLKWIQIDHTSRNFKT